MCIHSIDPGRRSDAGGQAPGVSGFLIDSQPLRGAAFELQFEVESLLKEPPRLLS